MTKGCCYWVQPLEKFSAHTEQPRKISVTENPTLCACGMRHGVCDASSSI